jgi:shikimate dehydrogenase
MKFIYLFGYPLGHSISPSMQNAGLRQVGLTDLEYVKKPLPPERMDEMIAGLEADDCIGANVTVPHKQAIAGRLDELSELAREIGAVNTVNKRTRANGTSLLVGDNTDVYGFWEALRVRGIDPGGMRAAILGAGGGAAAAAYALAQGGAREINLLNRTLARAVVVGDRLNKRFPQLELALNDWEALEKADLIVNATSVGMTPRSEDSPLPANVKLARGVVVYDLVYNPPQTKFLREAEAKGAHVIGGLEMLVYQGARSFELWTGKPAPVAVMMNEAENALDEMMAHGKATAPR